MDLIETFEINRALRNEIFDVLEGLQFSWSGRSTTTTFLGALYDLEALPSYDSRFTNAFQDIRQHTEFNYDWDESWVISDPRFQLLTGPDHAFLAFVAKSLSARRDWESEEQTEIQKDLNEMLRESGFSLEVKLQLSSGFTFQPKLTKLSDGLSVETLSEMFTNSGENLLEIEYIRKMLSRASNAVDAEPELAIGTAKEILEATYKQLLSRLGVAFSEQSQPNDLATKLYPNLNFENMGDGEYFQESLTLFLKTVVNSVTALRNSKGTGHGRTEDTNTSMHLAKLVLLTVCSHCEFLVRQYELKNTENINRTAHAM